MTRHKCFRVLGKRSGSVSGNPRRSVPLSAAAKPPCTARVALSTCSPSLDGICFGRAIRMPDWIFPENPDCYQSSDDVQRGYVLGVALQ